MRKGGEKEKHLMKRDGKQETWMLFLGVFSQTKELMSKELKLFLALTVVTLSPLV